LLKKGLKIKSKPFELKGIFFHRTLVVENIVKKIDSLLKKNRYETFYFSEEKSKFCFDLLVKKDNTILLVKVFSNIDNLNENVIKGIKSMSTLLHSKPVLIGIKNRYQKLEDDTIYVREELPFITYNTFEKIIGQNAYPYVLARRGGGVIFLDGALMKDLREKKGLTRKELSEELEVTKRTICSYENESMRPSQQIADRVLEVLDDPNRSIFKNINVFEWQVKFNINKEYSFEGLDLNPFESHLQDVITDIGINTHWYKKGIAPFELSIHSKHYSPELKIEKDFYPLFSKVPGEKNELSFKYFIYMFTKLFQKKGIFIVDNDFKVSDFFKQIPVLKINTIEELDSEEEFIELVKEEEK